MLSKPKTNLSEQVTLTLALRDWLRIQTIIVVHVLKLEDDRNKLFKAIDGTRARFNRALAKARSKEED